MRFKTQYTSLFPVPALDEKSTIMKDLLTCAQVHNDDTADRLAMEIYGLRQEERQLLRVWGQRTCGAQSEVLVDGE